MERVDHWHKRKSEDGFIWRIDMGDNFGAQVYEAQARLWRWEAVREAKVFASGVRESRLDAQIAADQALIHDLDEQIKAKKAELEEARRIEAMNAREGSSAWERGE